MRGKYTGALHIHRLTIETQALIRILNMDIISAARGSCPAKPMWKCPCLSAHNGGKGCRWGWGNGWLRISYLFSPVITIRKTLFKTPLSGRHGYHVTTWRHHIYIHVAGCHVTSQSLSSPRGLPEVRTWGPGMRTTPRDMQGQTSKELWTHQYTFNICSITSSLLYSMKFTTWH